MKYEAKNDKNLIDLSELTKDELISKVLLLNNKTAELEKQIYWMNELMISANRKIYGSSSEKTAVPEQISFFNEAEAESDPMIPELQIEEITYSRRKKKGKRETDLAALPLTTIEYELDPSEST